MRIFSFTMIAGFWGGSNQCIPLQMRNCIISERPCLTAAEFYHTMEVLQKLIVPQVPSGVAFGVQQLIDTARSQHQ